MAAHKHDNIGYDHHVYYSDMAIIRSYLACVRTVVHCTENPEVARLLIKGTLVILITLDESKSN